MNSKIKEHLGIIYKMLSVSILIFLFLISFIYLFEKKPHTPIARPQEGALHEPDISTLLTILNKIIITESNSWEIFDYKNFEGDYLTSPWSRILIKTLNTELNLHYKNLIPNSGKILENGELQNTIWFPPTTSWLFIQNGIVELINRKFSPDNIEKINRFNIPFFELHLSQNYFEKSNELKWLLEVNSNHYNVYGWVPIEYIDGKFQLIPNDIPYTNQHYKSGLKIHVLPDMNQDNTKDILVIFDGQAYGSTYVTLDIISDFGGKLKRIGTFNYQPANPKFPFEIIQKPQHNHIQLKTKMFANWGCEWEQTAEYTWEGAAEKEIIYQSLPPKNQNCNLAQAISPNSGFSLEQKNAILEESISSQINPEYITLLNIHLAMNYSALGQTFQAKESFENIFKFKGDTKFLSIVRSIHQTSKGFPFVFCEKLIENLNQITFEDPQLTSYFSFYNHYRSYGKNPFSYELLLCPLHKTIEFRINQMTGSSALDPDDILKDTFHQEIPYSVQTNLDKDLDYEWIIQLGSTFPLVVISDNIDNNWKFFPTKAFGFKFSDPILVQEPGLKTEYLESYLLLKPDAISRITYTCSNEQNNEILAILIIKQELKNWETDVKYICHNPNQYFDKSFKYITNIWNKEIIDSRKDINPEKIIDHLFTLSETGFNTTDLEKIRKEISEIKSDTVFGDENYPYLHEYLTYIMGLTYELEKKENYAFKYYSLLLNSKANSPWKKLAISKLVKIEEP